ncbi:hypothetical protein [Blastopirellula marina]|uniref:Uncharacterized protein n=1 Tax=Blastopirellula marina TaxID=124 RepID=A0A2S8GTH2_9BACT|nr:hypothetical protein [Blastopirellula marina]PQO47710.1 hypothetical protein C5Y93_03380 [Blastopirellula marina]
MIRRIEAFELYHFALGAICVAIFFLGCAPPPSTVPDQPTPPAIDSTVDPDPLDTEREGKVDIDIGGGQGVDIDIEGRTDNPAK